MARQRTTIRSNDLSERAWTRPAFARVTEVAILGRLEVRRSGQTIEIRRPAQRRLLALLLVEAGKPLPMDRLIDRFWPGPRPSSARRVIHTHVFELRRLLGFDAIETVGDGYRWSTQLSVIDADQFERAVHEADRAWALGDLATVVQHANLARCLWAGEPFSEIEQDAVARPVAERLTARWRHATELHAMAMIRLDRASEAVPLLAEAAAAEPLDERVAELLCRATVASGRPAAGLRSLAAHREALLDCGLVPPAWLHELEAAILRRDDARPLRAIS